MTSPSVTPEQLFVERYHVPKNQCYEGSRGGQAGAVHLHAPGPIATPTVLSAVQGRAGKLVLAASEALCRRRGWYERPVEHEGDRRIRCAECVRRSERYGVEWPADPGIGIEREATER